MVYVSFAKKRDIARNCPNQEHEEVCAFQRTKRYRQEEGVVENQIEEVRDQKKGKACEGDYNIWKLSNSRLKLIVCKNQLGVNYVRQVK